MVEAHIASIQRGSPKKVSYQRNEKLGGGKVNALADEKDIGITIRIGTVRKTRPNTPATARARRVQIEPPITRAPSCRGPPVEPAVAGEDQERDDQQECRDRRRLLPARKLIDQRVEQV